MYQEANLIKNSILVCLDTENRYVNGIKDLTTNFHGTVYENTSNLNIDETVQIYLCGNIANILKQLQFKQNYCIVYQLSYNYSPYDYAVDLGQVPTNVHNVGVYFKKMFLDPYYFYKIREEHKFQKLTESNKPDFAQRDGIYITPITKNENDELNFNLLRCSSNLMGPTDNFRESDTKIVNTLNSIRTHYFDNSAKLNHILAQTYWNNNKNTKAKIKQHSDKTKDMPKNGIMAFCTFYQDYDKNFKNINKKIKRINDFDYVYNETSILTNLHFRLKDCIDDDSLIKEFSLPLYPNSVFLMSLKMNRLYTHEIRPSVLPIDKIPTRLGYVVRCSNRKAVFKNNKTFIKNDNSLTELEQPTEEGTKKLKKLYFLENTSDIMVNYDEFNFSLNTGDYLEPNY